MRCWRHTVTVVLLLATGLAAQDYGARLGTVQRGGRLSYEPTGPGVLFDALDPAVRKVTVPQELYAEYGWRQWQYSNYARVNYQRYVATALEGDYIYDLYGNYLTRGWLLYDWRQESPQPFGSTLEKSSRFAQWFNNLVIAADHHGQYHYAITVGNQIRTTLTPMTFSKPLFNGVQIDFASDRYQATVLLSRISEPNALGGSQDQRTNNTNLVGGRFVSQVGDFVRVGGTFVSAYHVQTQLEPVAGDLFAGHLTESQNFAPVTVIELALTDDSPEDNDAGAALFSSDIVVTSADGDVYRGSENGYRPQIEGGFQRLGYLSADGFERMVVRYDLNDIGYTGPDPADIEAIELEMVLANDYRVEVSSDRQFNRRGETVFFPVERARGNPDDGSNQRVVTFDYGLPTANQIAGFTIEATDLADLTGYLEVDVNRRYRQFPNPNLERHHTVTDEAVAWFANLSRVSRPLFLHGEWFHVDPDYTTSIVTASADGLLDVGNEFELYELVEDNDDQDRRPDWRRKGWGPGDDEIYPGWDENNDFISDFNQNDNIDSPNLVPDYDEPFLRFHADRPEMLFGVDMNHNGVVDRFENDDEPDLPYDRDRKGHNLYGGLFLGPDTRLTVGRLRMRQFTDARRSRADYLLLTGVQRSDRGGRLRWFHDLRRVHDNIPDDLIQWVQQPGNRGTLQLMPDPLAAQDAWIATTWLGHDIEPVRGLLLQQKVKWRTSRQLLSGTERGLQGLRRTSGFFGLVNKAELTLNRSRWTLLPRWKSEYLRRRPALRADAKAHELTELLMLVGRHPVMRRSYLEAGVEHEWFHQFIDPAPAGADESFRGLTCTVQVGNVSDYQGYIITTLLGFEARRLWYEEDDPETLTRAFITMYAGVQD